MTDKRRESVLALANNSLTIQEVVQRSGASITTVRRYVKEANAELKRENQPPCYGFRLERDDNVARELEATRMVYASLGGDLAATANELAVSEATVRRRLTKLGIKFTKDVTTSAEHVEVLDLRYTLRPDEIAGRLNISQATVNRHTKGEGKTLNVWVDTKTLRTLARLAEYDGVSVEGYIACYLRDRFRGDAP